MSDRHELQAAGTHPAPCARHCESTAFEIEIRRLRAELAASREREARMQWQPIETAPRDGTHVLIYVPEASRQKVMEAYWVTPWEGAPTEQCWWSTPAGPVGRGYMVLQKEVTNWNPMPSPPPRKL